MYTIDGHKPAQSKVTAIVQMPSPGSKKEVQSFIGMINYLSKFSPRLTELAEPIRELVKEKVPFKWGPEHDRIILPCSRREIIKAPVLAYYNPQKRNSAANGCKYKRLRGLVSYKRRDLVILCQQSTD